jgi:carbon-monoxide dehydrogenase medium subunit
MVRPTSVQEAVAVLSYDDLPLGGGTELLLSMRMRVLRPDTLVNLKSIDDLGEVSKRDDTVVIGGGVTHLEAASHPLVKEHHPILTEVLLQVGNPRVRASGTLAGNLVFAEPKSDVIPILLALDAGVDLTSPTGSRHLSIDEFILGPYFSAREPDELLTSITIPTGRIARAVYRKFQTMERPTVGVAAVDRRIDGAITRRVVVGAVSDLPVLWELDPSDPRDGSSLAASIEPIADVAGSVRYKRHVTAVFIDKALADLDQEELR